MSWPDSILWKWLFPDTWPQLPDTSRPSVSNIGFGYVRSAEWIGTCSKGRLRGRGWIGTGCILWRRGGCLRSNPISGRSIIILQSSFCSHPHPRYSFFELKSDNVTLVSLSNYPRKLIFSCFCLRTTVCKHFYSSDSGIISIFSLFFSSSSSPHIILRLSRKSHQAYITLFVLLFAAVSAFYRFRGLGCRGDWRHQND